MTVFPGYISAFTASTYFTVLVSFERYVAVCKPFESLRIFPSKRRTLCYITAIIISSAVFNLPKWWEQEPEVCVEVITREGMRKECDAGKDGKSCHVNLTQESLRVARRFTRTNFLGDDHVYVYYIAYVSCANILVNFLLPLGVLLVLNVSIYRGV